MRSRVLLELDAVLLSLDGELAANSVLDIAYGWVEVVDGKPAHRGERRPSGGELTRESFRQRSDHRYCSRGETDV